MKVYSLDYLAGVRDTTWLEPKPAEVQLATYWDDRIAKHVYDLFYGKQTLYGVSREFAKLWMTREMLRFVVRYKFSYEVSFMAAKVNLSKFLAERAAALGWLAVGLAVALTAWAVYLAVVDITEKDQGYAEFPPGACIMRYKESLFWAGVTGHPRPFEWHLVAFEPIGQMTFFEYLHEGRGYMKDDEWDFMNFWEAKESKLIGWYSYSFGSCHLKYLGVARREFTNMYRLYVSPDWPEPWDWPVGWGIREYDARDFLRNFKDLWR